MPKGIYKRKPLTKEHKEAISNGVKLNLPITAFKKGQRVSAQTEFKKGHKPWNTNKICPSISIAQMGHPFTWSKTKPRKALRRNCLQCSKQFQYYPSRPRKYCSSKCYFVSIVGKPRVNCRGENCHFWKGGITKLKTGIMNLLEYKEWRHEVFVRDNFTCIECHNVGGILNAHHIKPISKILEENNITLLIEAQLCKELWNIDNGVTLCEKCHHLTGNYGWKLMWKKEIEDNG